MHQELRFSSDTGQPQRLNDKGQWVDVIPEPFWTTKGLPIWKRFNERNWLPQCVDCPDAPIFKTRERWEDHYVSNHKSDKKTWIVS